MDTDGNRFIKQADHARLFRLARSGDQVVLTGAQRLDRDGNCRTSTQQFQAVTAHADLSHDPRPTRES